MWVIAFLCTLLLSTQYGLANLQGPKGEVEEVILDITNPNPEFIDTITRSPYGLVTRIYVARGGYKISSVAEKEEPIWEDEDLHCEHVTVLTRGESRTHVNIYLRDEYGKRACLYYERDDEANDWDEATEGNFYSIFQHRAENEGTFESISVDFCQKTTCKTYLVANSQKLPFLLFAPNVSYRIEKMLDGNDLIWEANNEDERCIHASFYPRDIPTLAYLVIQSLAEVRDLYYKKVGNSWTSVDKNGYLADLKQAGFDESQVSDEITMDIADVHSDCFYTTKYPINNYGVNSYVPSLGFKLKSITEGNADIWKVEEGSAAKCTYINVVYKDAVFCALFILVEDPNNDRHVLYFVKNDKKWKNVSKEEYYGYITKENGLEPLGNIENPKVVMSSFTNKQGLRIATYASRVEDAKGDVILVHGLLAHFKSDFCASSTEWNFEHFGSPMFQDLGEQFMDEKHVNSLIAGHRHIFEHARFEGMDAFEVAPRYEYRHSLVEYLNRLGYNVYGYDHQSHGLSESVKTFKCHVEEFSDYIYDLLQFFSIVKRDKFDDSSEKWNQDLIYEQGQVDKKIFLLGHSMGGNIIIQAIQEFYKSARMEYKFVDGVIGISSMLNLDNHADTIWKRAGKPFLGAVAWAAPESIYSIKDFMNYGESFDFFTRFNDPFFNTHKLTYKTFSLLSSSCSGVHETDNIIRYPENLPTLLIHSTGDEICSIQGPRDMANKHLKSHQNVKLVEYEGSLHFLTVPQSLILSQTHLEEFLDRVTED
ncbi:conserved hypothetical protein [Theileria equi strain WA]|uniref:Serine aminopeptidase S33 domain-containing protein n=1 Tax=Theileria equi strain WA TaxID=1537102 RepID=L1LF63_THEEQ|nr:conserved hypothetical protein [Theileria equi strain WA]EKX73924.1 conserved hypothetical protein [Theileria equi strain WA]|eukprot:XP_004833376.1 conserved hypothetical protein [Theileria equi strain WA]